ncbi:MAG: hypothetical protein AAF752_04055 [Bacteroidota bacterium]
MPQISISEDALRKLLKSALAEALEERRDLLLDVVTEALEEAALTEAIREGESSEPASREEVFSALKGHP